jgi:signal transduction histidine kinase
MAYFIKKTILIIIALWVHTTLIAQHFATFHYNQQNGLPQNSVIDLWFDQYNFLWLTTESGLVRFDGHKFKTFESASIPQIDNDRFRWIHQTPNKQIITSTSSGQLWRIYKTGIVAIKQPKLPKFHLFARGIPSVKTLTDFKLLDNSYFRSKDIKEFPTSIIAINNEEYYVLGRKYLYLMRGVNKLDSFVSPEEKMATLFSINNIVYVKSFGNNIYAFMPGKRTFTKCILPKEFIKDTSTIYWKSGYSNPLFTFRNQLYTLHAENDFTKLYSKELIADLPVKSAQINQIIYNQHKNIIAIATRTNGFYILKTNFFSTHNCEEQNSGSYVQIALSDSTILDGHGHAIGDYKINRSAYSIATSESILYIDKFGKVWFAKGDTLFTQKNGINNVILIDKSTRYRTIFEHLDTILVSSDKSIFALHNYKVIAHYTFHPNIYVAEAFAPQYFTWFKNKYYYGASNGVYTFQLNNQLSITPKKISTIPFVRYLKPCDNYVLGCSYGSGIFAILGNDTIVHFPLDKQKHLAKSHNILFDNSNRAFISTNNGLFYTSKTGIEKYIYGKVNDLHYQYLNENEGLKNVEFNGGITESCIKLTNGSVSYSNMGGFVRFNPANIPNNFPDSTIFIDQIIIDGKEVARTDSVLMKANSEHLTVTIAAAYWGNPNNIRIDYKINDYNNDWVPIANENNRIELLNLPSGRHILTIRKRIGFGESDFDYVYVVLIKKPKFYESIWFILLVITITLGAILGIILIYNRRLRTQNMLLENRVSERTHELEKSNHNLRESEHELLQSVNVKNKLISIISHDIVTPIKFISIVSRNYKSSNESMNTQEKEVIREIHHTSQRLHENAQNILNWVRYQNNLIKVHPTKISPYSIVEDTCDLLQEIAVSRKNTLINNVVMDDIIQADKTILTIIVQNIISNAVKYTHSSNIIIKSSSENNKYILSIVDNGQGISNHNLTRIESIRNKTKTNMFDDSADGTGLGYIIIFELAEMIGATINIESSLETGTSVHISL